MNFPYERLFKVKSQKIFFDSVKKSGLNDGVVDSRQRVVFHTLRHTFASWLIQEGISIPVISQLLGHSSIKLTMRYAHLSPNYNKSAVDVISNIFNY